MAAPDAQKQFNGGTRPAGAFIPTIVEETPNGRTTSDPFSRLLKEQTIYLYEDVNNVSSAILVAQLLHLMNNGEKSKGIDFYIQSPGGSVYDGEAVIDAMEKLKDDGWIIRTYAVGLSMSMGSQFLVAGSRGHRWALPNATIMLHEPAGGGNNGKAEDQINSVTEIAHMKTRTALRYAATTNLSYEEAMNRIITGPDYFIRAEEALALGIVDHVDYPKNNPKLAAALKWANEEHYRLHKEAQEQPGLLKKAPDFGKSEYVAPAPVQT